MDDPTTIDVLGALGASSRPMTACEIAAKIERGRVSVRHRLLRLVRAGRVVRSGRWSYQRSP